MKRIIYYIGFCCCLLIFQACKKDFLDDRPNKALLVPTTLADFRALLDNNFIFNNTPGLTDLSTDDFYTTEEGYNGFNLDMERNSYTWAKDIFAGVPSADWNLPYQQVFYANVVLEGLGKLTQDSIAEKRNIRGTALFHRAFAFFNLLQQFAKPYDAATAQTDPGIPLRLKSDVTPKVPRGTIQQAYTQLLADLSAARKLLPVVTAYKSRPTVTAAQALFARVYLTMGNFSMAGKYADSVLAVNASLIDYNSLDSSISRPFPRALPDGNNEVIFYAALSSYTFLSSAAPVYIDSMLYRSYDKNDLRRVLFGRELEPGKFKFKGNYAGTLLFFSGLATDEMYLISSECSARSGNPADAASTLNKLLRTRWATGTYVPYQFTSNDRVLLWILGERRKELVGRSIRWTDLRRLNKETSLQVVLERQVNGTTFTLEPGSNHYVFPIPDEEVKLSGLAQNPR
jgi:hypothetical protein